MEKMQINNRTIFNKDNLDILRGINSSSIDLIYLDPPFNKKKVFTAPIGSSAEGAEFSDIFRQKDVKDEWKKDIKEDYDKLSNYLEGIDNLSKKGEKVVHKDFEYTYCYLCYMAIRLIEMHRILKDTGSIYLHCDSTMSHYLKILLDIIFGEKHFRNEIIWRYTGNSIPKYCFPRKHDTVFWYSKSESFKFYPKEVLVPYSDSTLKRYNHVDQEGKRYKISALRDGKQEIIYMKEGKYADDVWEIPVLRGKESIGYPTQKPLALLERIIKASSNEGDIVLDPFCGCATTCIAAERLNREWIGIDVSVKAFELVKQRLKKEVQSDLFETKEVPYTTIPPVRTDRPRDFLEKKYVYIVSNPKERYLKVGIAKDWKSRLNSYQTTDSQRAFKMEYKVLTHKFREMERHIHKHFKSYGEWVDAPLQDIIDEMNRFNNEK